MIWTYKKMCNLDQISKICNAEITYLRKSAPISDLNAIVSKG